MSEAYPVEVFLDPVTQTLYFERSGFIWFTDLKELHSITVRLPKGLKESSESE